MSDQDATDDVTDTISNDEGLYNICMDMRDNDLESHFMESWAVEHPYSGTLYLTPCGYDLNRVDWQEVEDCCKSKEDCEHCGNRWDECDCEECTECGHKEDDCTCPKCGECDNLEEKCTCCPECEKYSCECEEVEPDLNNPNKELDPRLK